MTEAEHYSALSAHWDGVIDTQRNAASGSGMSPMPSETELRYVARERAAHAKCEGDCTLKPTRIASRMAGAKEDPKGKFERIACTTCGRFYGYRELKENR